MAYERKRDPATPTAAETGKIDRSNWSLQDRIPERERELHKKKNRRDLQMVHLEYSAKH